MIAKLRGRLDSVGDDWLVVDVGGVGYLVFASARTLSAAPPMGGDLDLFIETHVREDHIHLYGFMSGRERDLFRLLLTVQGVGAKVALAILSILEPDALETAVAAQDKAAIAQASGVGPKLAGRIVNELKDKVAAAALAGAARPALAAVAGGDRAGDAVSALVNLGYRPSEAHGAVATAANDLGPDADVAALIRAGLKELAR